MPTPGDIMTKQMHPFAVLAAVLGFSLPSDSNARLTYPGREITQRITVVR
jgi:hypothetical protein